MSAPPSEGTGLVRRLTRPAVLAIFALVQALAVAGLAVAYLAALDGPLSPDKDRVVTGDYVAFLTGAAMIAEGRGESLYDLGEQARIQQRIVGARLDAWQPYVYPPLLAVLMTPLAGLSFLHGFQAHVAVMLLAGCLGAAALVSLVPHLAARRMHAAALVLLALGFHPIARTTFGGQNTTLTWALATGALWALDREREVLAGLLLGLLSYKPQYLPLLLVVLALARSWTALGVALAGCLAHYAIGAALVGWDWPLGMLRTVEAYRSRELFVHMHFSLSTFFGDVAGGTFGPVLAVIAGAAVLATLVRFAPRARPGAADFRLLWALAFVAGTLVSPYLQYYDFGVMMLPAAIGLDALLARGRSPGTAARLLGAAIYVGYPWLTTPGLWFQPLTLWAVALFAWLAWIASLTGPEPSGSTAP